MPSAPVMILGDSTMSAHRKMMNARKGKSVFNKCSPAQILTEITHWESIAEQHRMNPNSTSSTRCTIEPAGTAKSLIELMMVFKEVEMIEHELVCFITLIANCLQTKRVIVVFGSAQPFKQIQVLNQDAIAPGSSFLNHLARKEIAFEPS